MNRPVKQVYYLIFFLIFQLEPGSAVAQSVQECRSVLINATYSRHDSHFLDWRLAESLTQDEYHEAKRNASVNAVIYGVPVGANYDDFQKNIRNMSTSRDKSISDSQITNVLWTGLDPSSAVAYSRCIDGIRGSTGLSLRAVSATSSDITLVVRWTPQSGQPSSIPLDWGGLSVPSSTLPRTLSAGSGVPVIVERPRSEQSLSVKWLGQGDWVTLTPLPPLPTPPPPTPAKQRAAKIEIAAVKFTSSQNVAGNVFAQFGDVITNDPPAVAHANMAEWKFRAIGGPYRLYVEYAAAESRPVNVFVNGQTVARGVLGDTTGCWMLQCQHVVAIATVTLADGANVIRIDSPSIFPHIRTLIFDP